MICARIIKTKRTEWTLHEASRRKVKMDINF
jgi:hypothetical protein